MFTVSANCTNDMLVGIPNRVDYLNSAGVPAHTNPLTKITDALEYYKHNNFTPFHMPTTAQIAAGSATAAEIAAGSVGYLLRSPVPLNQELERTLRSNVAIMFTNEYARSLDRPIAEIRADILNYTHALAASGLVFSNLEAATNAAAQLATAQGVLHLRNLRDHEIAPLDAAVNVAVDPVAEANNQLGLLATPDDSMETYFKRTHLEAKIAALRLLADPTVTSAQLQTLARDTRDAFILAKIPPLAHDAAVCTEITNNPACNDEIHALLAGNPDTRAVDLTTITNRLLAAIAAAGGVVSADQTQVAIALVKNNVIDPADIDRIYAVLVDNTELKQAIAANLQTRDATLGLIEVAVLATIVTDHGDGPGCVFAAGGGVGAADAQALLDTLQALGANEHILSDSLHHIAAAEVGANIDSVVAQNIAVRAAALVGDADAEAALDLIAVRAAAAVLGAGGHPDAHDMAALGVIGGCVCSSNAAVQAVAQVLAVERLTPDAEAGLVAEIVRRVLNDGDSLGALDAIALGASAHVVAEIRAGRIPDARAYAMLAAIGSYAHSHDAALIAVAEARAVAAFGGVDGDVALVDAIVIRGLNDAGSLAALDIIAREASAHVVAEISAGSVPDARAYAILAAIGGYAHSLDMALIAVAEARAVAAFGGAAGDAALVAEIVRRGLNDAGSLAALNAIAVRASNDVRAAGHAPDANDIAALTAISGYGVDCYTSTLAAVADANISPAVDRALAASLAGRPGLDTDPDAQHVMETIATRASAAVVLAGGGVHVDPNDIAALEDIVRLTHGSDLTLSAAARAVAVATLGRVPDAILVSSIITRPGLNADPDAQAVIEPIAVTTAAEIIRLFGVGHPLPAELQQAVGAIIIYPLSSSTALNAIAALNNVVAIDVPHNLNAAIVANIVGRGLNDADAQAAIEAIAVGAARQLTARIDALENTAILTDISNYDHSNTAALDEVFNADLGDVVDANLLQRAHLAAAHCAAIQAHHPAHVGIASTIARSPGVHVDDVLLGGITAANLGDAVDTLVAQHANASAASHTAIANRTANIDVLLNIARNPSATVTEAVLLAALGKPMLTAHPRTNDLLTAVGARGLMAPAVQAECDRLRGANRPMLISTAAQAIVEGKTPSLTGMQAEEVAKVGQTIKQLRKW